MQIKANSESGTHAAEGLEWYQGTKLTYLLYWYKIQILTYCVHKGRVTEGSSGTERGREAILLQVAPTYSTQPRIYHAALREEYTSELLKGRDSRESKGRCSVYLLYWYKSTNTDVLRLRLRQLQYRPKRQLTGTQFTCFTGTKVRILTHSCSGWCKTSFNIAPQVCFQDIYEESNFSAVIRSLRPHTLVA
jgi:hypothetical protein